MSPPKTCAVCGDKALGYNFNAVTCESCKAFFRRNALAKKQFTCPFNQNCEMTVITRRFCQKCRLKRCLDIGMKSENIMSEEDKLIKRRKIENNRAKRGLNDKKHRTNVDKGGESNEIKHESVQADSSGFDVSHDSQSSFDSAIGGTSRQAITSTALLEPLQDVNPDLMTSEEIVEFIVGDPDRASQAISKIMRTPTEAVCTVEKIINSQKDALRLISHLIAFPGDALKIISKIMNSPFDALTVFTKFMSSPTDGLEIISKVVSSPQDVLQFIRNLMDSPEDGIDIMNKFMNTPAEALKILNKIFNGPSHGSPDDSVTNLVTEENPGTFSAQQQQASAATSHAPVQENTSIVMENTIIHTILNQSPMATQSVLVSPPPSSVSVASPASPYTSATPVAMGASPSPTSCFTSSPTPSSPFTTSTTVTMGASPATPSPYTPSPQPMSLTSPVSIAPSEMQYNSPSSLHSEDLPSTSSMTGLMPSSPTHLSNSADADFSSDQFDIRAFMQNGYPDHNTTSFDSINSLESVLSEVIRIEYQALNNLLTEPRIKQEQHGMHAIPSSGPHYNGVYQSSPCNPQPQLIYPTSTSMIAGRELNEAEQMKLRELKLASEALYYPVDDDLSMLMIGDDRMKPDETHQDPKLLQVINLTAVAIKRLIKMAKKITAFRDMCQEDQVALLKGGCTEMMIMRGVMTYNDNRKTWKIPHTKEDMSNIRAEVLKLAKGNLYEEHMKFISTFDEKWRMDENIILIMCAIVLFTPTRQRIIHSDVIRLEQNSYYYLLRRYLESVYPGCEAKSAFIKLIQKISDVERLNQVIIGVYLNVNPSQVEPLLREIFDIKHY